MSVRDGSAPQRFGQAKSSKALGGVEHGTVVNRIRRTWQCRSTAGVLPASGDPDEKAEFSKDIFRRILSFMGPGAFLESPANDCDSTSAPPTAMQVQPVGRTSSAGLCETELVF